MPAKVRGRAACNQCRSRKQKCDEKRPICSRCRDLNKPCQWPGLRKRGPAKGYTEALEHRLRDTECALLQIISVIDGATLASAFTDSARAGTTDSHLDSKTDKADMAAHWEQFPLSTPEDVLSWAQDHWAGRTAPAVEASARPAARLGQPLLNHGMPIGFESSFTASTAEFPRSSVNISTSTFMPGGSPESNHQENTFDMPEQFKAQYLW